MQIRDVFSNVAGRWSASWRSALACAAAAELSWFLARHLLGHPRPVFAAVAAIICLSPGLPSYVHQGVGMVLGVAIGVVIGEAALVFKSVDGSVLICIVTLVAIMLAVSFGSAPVIPIQAAVSALLVLVLGPATAGTARLEDVGVGAAVGLVLSQILPTAHPVRALEDAARTMREALRRVFHRPSKP